MYYNTEAKKLVETCDALEYRHRVSLFYAVPPLIRIEFVGLFQVRKRLTEEESRVCQYLSLRTLDRLLAIVRNTFLTVPQTLVNTARSDVDTMIDQDEHDDLARFYRLSSLIPDGLPSLGRSLKALIQQRGTELNRVSIEMRELGESSIRDKAQMRTPKAQAHGPAQVLQWVEDMLRLKEKIGRVWEVSFKKDRKIGSVIDEVNPIHTKFVVDAWLT
jgi:cullin 3